MYYAEQSKRDGVLYITPAEADFYPPQKFWPKNWKLKRLPEEKVTKENRIAAVQNELDHTYKRNERRAALGLPAIPTQRLELEYDSLLGLSGGRRSGLSPEEAAEHARENCRRWYEKHKLELAAERAAEKAAEMAEESEAPSIPAKEETPSPDERREARLAYMREYARAHYPKTPEEREKFNAKRRQRYHDNPEWRRKVIGYTRKWELAHPEKKTAAIKRYQQEHKEEIAAYQREYYRRSHPEKNDPQQETV